MVILLNILYVFRTLPIPLKPGLLNSLSALLTKFMYLINHRKIGGMGLVDIKDYCIASPLTHSKHKFNPHSEALWVEIEKHLGDVPNLI